MSALQLGARVLYKHWQAYSMNSCLKKSNLCKIANVSWYSKHQIAMGTKAVCQGSVPFQLHPKTVRLDLQALYFVKEVFLDACLNKAHMNQ